LPPIHLFIMAVVVVPCALFFLPVPQSQPEEDRLCAAYGHGYNTDDALPWCDMVEPALPHHVPCQPAVARSACEASEGVSTTCSRVASFSSFSALDDEDAADGQSTRGSSASAYEHGRAASLASFGTLSGASPFAASSSAASSGEEDTADGQSTHGSSASACEDGRDSSRVSLGAPSGAFSSSAASRGRSRASSRRSHRKASLSAAPSSSAVELVAPREPVNQDDEQWEVSKETRRNAVERFKQEEKYQSFATDAATYRSLTPDPENRSFSKRTWEKEMIRWKSVWRW